MHTRTVDGFSLFHSSALSLGKNNEMKRQMNNAAATVTVATNHRFFSSLFASDHIHNSDHTVSMNSSLDENETNTRRSTYYKHDKNDKHSILSHIKHRNNHSSTNVHANVNVNVNVNSRTSRRHLISRTIPTLATILATSCSPLKAAAKVDVSGLRVEGSASEVTLVSPPPPKPSNPNNAIELAGIQYTPAAMILELAEQTASMEGMMRVSAADLEESGDTNAGGDDDGNAAGGGGSDNNNNNHKKGPKKSKKERIDAGARGEGPGVVTRNDLSQSIRYMVKNSKAEKIAPFAAMTLNSIPAYLVINNDSNINSNINFSFNKTNNKNAKDESTSDMTLEDYLIVAQKYERAREELRVEFEKMTKEEQEEGKTIVRAIRRRDQERMAIQLGIRADE